MKIARVVNKRIFKGSAYCIGKLSLNGVYVCDILEPPYRGLTKDSNIEEIKAAKKCGKTAIPTGLYGLDLDCVSPRFGNNTFYKRVCGGKLPRLTGVPCFTGVLIHCGNTVADTDACQLTGANKEKGKVLNSKEAFEKLMSLLKQYRYATYEVI